MEIRRLGVVFLAIATFGWPGGSASAQAVPPFQCQGAAPPLVVTAAVHSRALPYFIEVEVTVQNRTSGGIRVDPREFVLVPESGAPVPPAEREQVIYALRSAPGIHMGLWGAFSVGSVGVVVGVGPIDLSARAIEARLFRGGELAAGGAVTGSVYFRPASWPDQFTLVLRGLTLASGQVLPPLEVPNCRMPFRPDTPPQGPGTAPGSRLIAMDARATAGPLAVRVSRAEFTRLATTLSISIENEAATDADLFMALADARLTDESGRVYTARILRSDLPERVTGRGQIHGRVVFEPLPPDVTAAVLDMPGARVGGATYDLRVDLRF